MEQRVRSTEQSGGLRKLGPWALAAAGVGAVGFVFFMPNKNNPPIDGDMAHDQRPSVSMPSFGCDQLQATRIAGQNPTFRFSLKTHNSDNEPLVATIDFDDGDIAPPMEASKKVEHSYARSNHAHTYNVVAEVTDPATIIAANGVTGQCSVTVAVGPSR